MVQPLQYTGVESGDGSVDLLLGREDWGHWGIKINLDFFLPAHKRDVLYFHSGKRDDTKHRGLEAHGIAHGPI